MDLIPRPLIRAAAAYGTAHRDRYEKLYSRGTSTSILSPDWNLAGIRRVSGFVFTDLGTAPETLQQRGAIFSSLFRPGTDNPAVRRFQEVQEESLLSAYRSKVLADHPTPSQAELWNERRVRQDP